MSCYDASLSDQLQLFCAPFGYVADIVPLVSPSTRLLVTQTPILGAQEIYTTAKETFSEIHLIAKWAKCAYTVFECLLKPSKTLSTIEAI